MFIKATIKQFEEMKRKKMQKRTIPVEIFLLFLKKDLVNYARSDY